MAMIKTQARGCTCRVLRERRCHGARCVSIDTDMPEGQDEVFHLDNIASEPTASAAVHRDRGCCSTRGVKTAKVRRGRAGKMSEAVHLVRACGNDGMTTTADGCLDNEPALEALAQGGRQGNRKARGIVENKYLPVVGVVVDRVSGREHHETIFVTRCSRLCGTRCVELTDHLMSSFGFVVRLRLRDRQHERDGDNRVASCCRPRRAEPDIGIRSERETDCQW